MPRVAIVMNMFYTGLGIARSLGERGIPVIGLTSHRRIYGNFTRYARLRFCPDSREQPEALLPYLLRLGEELGEPAVIFPTRDDDVLFLDRHREVLSAHFAPAIPPAGAAAACLDKWQTYQCAQAAGVPTPRSWLVQSRADLMQAAGQLAFPCVLKPVSSHIWRKAGNWELVGGRKAVPIHGLGELLAAYDQISRAARGALLQEMVPGADDQLFVAACYLDRHSNLVAGFTARKLLQVPATCGTGCIVQLAERPELLDSAAGMLRQMRFSGIAEVEYKWDSRCGRFHLIEINPRPWDQHSLGRACGADLIHLAYCEHAGLPFPPVRRQACERKWIAEDVFLVYLLRCLRRGPRALGALLRLARGRRVYAIASRRDPLPFLALIAVRLFPDLLATAFRVLCSQAVRLLPSVRQPRELRYEAQKKRSAL